MIPEIKGSLLNKGDLDKRIIDPEILPVLKALRSRGVETMASCSGACDRPGHQDWGAYALLWVVEGVHLQGLIDLTESTTPMLQQRFNREAQLQLVSALAWYQDHETTSREILSGGDSIYRLQLAGPFLKGEYAEAWQIVREGI